MDDKLTEFLRGFMQARDDTQQGIGERTFETPPSAEFRDGYEGWRRQMFERPIEVLQ